MIKIPDGCILLARQIKSSDIWVKKPAWWLKVWSYILMEVNHKDNKFFKRGKNMFSRKQIHQNCHLSLDRIEVETVDNVLRWLRATTQITTRKTTRGIIINVSKYDFFQDLKNYKNETENDNINDMRNETETTQKRHRNDTINKNDNNDKNVITDTHIYNRHSANAILPKEALPEQVVLPLITKDTTVKIRYLEFVDLTEKQYNKLIKNFGQSKTDEMIRKLNNYIGQIGELKAKKKYSSHYHVILNWTDSDKTNKSQGFNQVKNTIAPEDKYANLKTITK